MFHAPVSESKEKSNASRTVDTPEPERQLHPPFAHLQSAAASTSVRGLAQSGAARPNAFRPGISQTGASQLRHLQRTIGNQGVLRMLSRTAPRIQAKLTVNEPGDRYEQEADQVADQVMRMTSPPQGPAPHIARTTSPSGIPALQRKCGCGGTCSNCKNGGEEAHIQRKQAGDSHDGKPLSGSDEDGLASEASSGLDQVLRFSGRPLDAEIRSIMEPRFGWDFRNVRVHTNPEAVESAGAVNALAYTVGQNIVFGAGQFAPHTSWGQRLIAHELTHVVQQAPGVPAGPPSNPSRSPTHPVRHNVPPMVQRQPAAKPAAVAAPKQAVIEDAQRAATGQMHRTEFLDTLQARLLRECGEELSVVGATARDCPYILKTIQYYRKKPLAQLLRLIQHFAHPPAGASAQGLIDAVAMRARAVARNLARGGAGHTTTRVHPMTAGRDGKLAAHNPAAVHSKLGTGHAFDGPARHQMEQSFGVGFGSVRIHTDSDASVLSSNLGARAFTVGRHIAFASGQYQPGTLSGDILLAHELAHTLQQGTEKEEAADVSRDLELEHQADRMAIAALSGRVLPGCLFGSSNGLRIQRGPAILAGALIIGEAGADVAVADGVVVLTSEVAAPAIADAVLAPAVVETLAPAAVETLAPAAVESLAPAAADVLAPAAAQSLAPAAVGVAAAAATTLSSDSGPVSRPDADTDEEEQQRECRGMAVGQRGGNTCHDQFAAMVSGVNREFGLETPEGLYVEFDALGLDRVLFEIKTGYGYLLNTSPATRELRERTLHRFIDQALEQTAVATRCGYPLVWVFNNEAVANYVNSFIPPHVTSIPFPCDMDR